MLRRKFKRKNLLKFELEASARLIAHADTARDAGKAAVAAILYEEALKIRPGIAAIHIQCAHMYKEDGDWSTAGIHYNKAEILTPNDPDLHLQLGHFFKVSGQFQEAVAAYSRAVALNPSWKEAQDELVSLKAALTANKPPQISRRFPPSMETPEQAARAPAMTVGQTNFRRSDSISPITSNHSHVAPNAAAWPTIMETLLLGLSAVTAPMRVTVSPSALRQWGGFDADWYRLTYADKLTPNWEAWEHYLAIGERENCRPNPLFDPEWYRRQYHLSADISPLGHYLSWYRLIALNPSPLFDAQFYTRQYAATFGHTEPLSHYLKRGWKLGFFPNPAFDSNWYARRYHLADGTNPLIHYLLSGATLGHRPHSAFDVGFIIDAVPPPQLSTPLEIYLAQPLSDRCPTPLFDTEWYYRTYDDVDPTTTDAFWHYYTIGYHQGHNPSALFNTTDYLRRNFDVQAGNINPLGHYVETGAAEGRVADARFDPAWYIKKAGVSEVSLVNALAHFVLVGWKAGLSPNPLFDIVWYVGQNADVAKANTNPLAHYIEHGWREGRAPNPFFDSRWYNEHYSFVLESGTDPLLHYLEHAISSGCDPSPRFSTSWYCARHPDVVAEGWNPLAHYIHVGRALGFRPHPDFGDALLPEKRDALDPGQEQIKPYESWLEVNSSTDIDNIAIKDRLEIMAGRLPKISVVMPVYNPGDNLLCAAIDSVLGQLYTDWELCICDDASTDPTVVTVLNYYSAKEKRIRWIQSATNQNISGASNMAASLATGEIIALLDHDDLLHPHALAETALRYAEQPKSDIVYSDDDKIDLNGNRFAPQFKPNWSPVLLLGFMYISHLLTFRRSLFESVGGFRLGYEGSQDYDLVLRMTEKARSIDRIPRVLYHWRVTPGSTAMGGDLKPAAFANGRRAVQDALDRRGIRATVMHPEHAIAARIGLFEPEFPDSGPSVTIIIPTRNKLELLQGCLASLKQTTYRNYDIIIVDNFSDDLKTLQFLKTCGYRVARVPSPPEGFSFAHVINAGVALATGDFVLLLNDDIEVKSPRWLSQMVGHAQISGVGAVGARLLYRDHRVQHGGITHGLHEGMAGHSFKLLADYDHGYMSLAKASREVSAVTGACLLTPRELFQTMGGLDGVNFRVAFNDVDYCYRLVDAGYACIQCASAELFHFEGSSRGFGDNPAEEAAMRRKYGKRIDRWYNPNLSLDHEQFEIARTHVPQNRSSPVRTLLVSHNLNHEGAPNSLFELANGLKQTGRVDPIVISPEDGPLHTRYDTAQISAHVIEHPLLGWPEEDQLNARLQRLAQTILYAGIEVVIVNTADGFWAVEVARLANLPCIWIIRESSFWADYFSHLPNQISRVARAAFDYPYKIVFVSRSTLEAWQPLNRKRSFTLIRNGLNTANFLQDFSHINRQQARAEMGTPDDACVFVCVGTVAERKGQLDLVRAFAMLPNQIVQKSFLLIIGDRPSDYSQHIHEEVARLPRDASRRVRIMAETDKARSYLVGSDVFLCSSRIESYPRVILEAMAAGLPIITTSVWGIREQVRFDYNARQYTPGNIGELAMRMEEMVENTATRELFASRSIPVLESLPDYSYMIDSYADLIEQAVGTRQ